MSIKIGFNIKKRSLLSQVIFLGLACCALLGMAATRPVSPVVVGDRGILLDENFGKFNLTILFFEIKTNNS